MENIGAGEATEHSENTGQETNVENVDNKGSGVESLDSAANSGAVEGAAETKSEETQDESIVEKDGQKFIPYERFQQLNERMKKAEETASFLEAIQNDPITRQKFVESLGINNQSQSKESPTSTVGQFQQFLQTSVEPQYQAHYRGMAEAISSEWEEFYEKDIESRLAPILSVIGAMKLKEVESANPDFKQYEKQVAELLAKHKSLSPEEAYILASNKDRFKKGLETGIKKAQNHQEKLNRTPVTKVGGGSSSTAKVPPKNLREALERAYDNVMGTK